MKREGDKKLHRRLNRISFGLDFFRSSTKILKSNCWGGNEIWEREF
jgi:hypothetical protein